MTKRPRLSLWWALLCLANFLFLIYLRTNLPDRFAVHFDLNGVPNGWATKSSFISQFSFFVGIINIVLFGSFFLLEKIPRGLINLPNKDYWFSTPEISKIGYLITRNILALTGIFVNIAFLFCTYLIFQESGGAVPIPISVSGGTFGILSGGLVLVVVIVSMAKVPSK